MTNDPTHPDDGTFALTPRQRRRAVTAAIVGNGLEFYDFVTFAFFAIQIGKTFFPSTDPFLSLMGSLATFGTGFLARPVGAWVIGGYADSHGRKPAMLLSMVLMGGGIAVLALTPGYATIGVAAPVIAILARLVQGFALGGEVGSATSYMMEAVRPERRGLATSFQGASQAVSGTIGALVGLLLSLWLTSQELTDYGWRIALLLGTSVVPFALYVRRALPETLHGTAHDMEPLVQPHAPPARFRRITVLGMMMIGGGTIATYIFKYMATYGQATLRLSETVSMAGEFANNAVEIVAMLTGGWLSDRFGRKPVIIPAQAAFVLAIIPAFLWLTEVRTATAFIGANLILSALSGFAFAPVYATISESLPQKVRARAFALIYTLPVTFLGGSTQMVVTWLLHVTGNPLALAWYLVGAGTLSLAAMVLLHESAPVRLRVRSGIGVAVIAA